MMAKRTITGTKNYRLFTTVGVGNRPLDPAKHRKLKKSLQQYGFRPECPLICWRNKQGQLEVQDGQHRLALSEELGIPVFYIETEQPLPIADHNGTSVPWSVSDYARQHAEAGKADYREALDFSAQYGLSPGTGFGLLSGASYGKNIVPSIKDGTFKIKDRRFAVRAAGLYKFVRAASRDICKGERLMDAIVACFRVDGFDERRIEDGAAANPDLLKRHVGRDEYLEMLESLYNFKRREDNRRDLAHDARVAMRDRRPKGPVPPTHRAYDEHRKQVERLDGHEEHDADRTAHRGRKRKTRVA